MDALIFNASLIFITEIYVSSNTPEVKIRIKIFIVTNNIIWKQESITINFNILGQFVPFA